MSSSAWTHPICQPCWDRNFPGREPIIVTFTDPELCCFCREREAEGIYVRHDPAELECGGVHSTEENLEQAFLREDSDELKARLRALDLSTKALVHRIEELGEQVAGVVAVSKKVLIIAMIALVLGCSTAPDPEIALSPPTVEETDAGTTSMLDIILIAAAAVIGWELAR